MQHHTYCNYIYPNDHFYVQQLAIPSNRLIQAKWVNRRSLNHQEISVRSLIVRSAVGAAVWKRFNRLHLVEIAGCGIQVVHNVYFLFVCVRDEFGVVVMDRWSHKQAWCYYHSARYQNYQIFVLIHLVVMMSNVGLQNNQNKEDILH